MNFYLSAVDETLRHPQDGPSIGLILCKERNRIVVEYALRDTYKPMGVAQYKLIEALPDVLKSELPTNEDLASEFPLMNLVSLRIRLERALAQIAKARHLEGEQRGIGALLVRLVNQKILSPKLAQDARAVARLLNSAVHGEVVEKKDAGKALKLGELVLTRLQATKHS